MNVDDFSNTHMLAFISALVAMGTLAFSILQHFSEARLSTLKAQFEAKQLIRAAQLDTALELMDLVGRFITPESEEQFDRDWHDFATIYAGRANLIDDDKFRGLIKRFGMHFWRDTDIGYEHFSTFEGAKQEEFERDGLNLNVCLNEIMLKQFYVGSRSKENIGSIGNSNV